MRDSQPSAKKTAVILPGIGYTCDRPLLYYSARLAASLGWEVVRVPYGGFPPKVQGDPERLRQSIRIAQAQTEDSLAGLDLDDGRELLFISKSIGTAVATAYAAQHGLTCRHVLLTPVEAAFEACPQDAVVFHGTADPWAETRRIVDLCQAAGIPLYITEGANHSLETGDALTDVQNLLLVLRQARAWLLRQPI